MPTTFMHCSNCGKVIDVTRERYWASTSLICDVCWQSFPLCDDEKASCDFALEGKQFNQMFTPCEEGESAL
jgi:hypothetical protein